MVSCRLAMHAQPGHGGRSRLASDGLMAQPVDDAMAPVTIASAARCGSALTAVRQVPVTYDVA